MLIPNRGEQEACRDANCNVMVVFVTNKIVNILEIRQREISNYHMIP